MDKFYDSILNVIIVGVVICSVIVLLFVGKSFLDTNNKNKTTEKKEFSEVQEKLMRDVKKYNTGSSMKYYDEKKENN